MTCRSCWIHKNENSSTLATGCKELTHWKRPWCWERLRAGGEGDDRGWDGWMASLTRWIWVWVNSGTWWWTGMPGVLRFIGSQRVTHDCVTELNWTEEENLFCNETQWLMMQSSVSSVQRDEESFMDMYVTYKNSVRLSSGVSAGGMWNSFLELSP